jgi:hypothetical protein
MLADKSLPTIPDWRKTAGASAGVLLLSVFTFSSKYFLPQQNEGVKILNAAGLNDPIMAAALLLMAGALARSAWLRKLSVSEDTLSKTSNPNDSFKDLSYQQKSATDAAFSNSWFNWAFVPLAFASVYAMIVGITTSQGFSTEGQKYCPVSPDMGLGQHASVTDTLEYFGFYGLMLPILAYVFRAELKGVIRSVFFAKDNKTQRRGPEALIGSAPGSEHRPSTGWGTGVLATGANDFMSPSSGL